MMIEREQLHDLRRRCVAVEHLVKQLNVDLARFSLAQGAKLDKDTAWMRWFERAFIKSGTALSCMSDLNIFTRKVVETYDIKSADSETRPAS